MLPEPIRRPLLLAAAAVLMLTAVVGVLLIVEELQGESSGDSDALVDPNAIRLEFVSPEDVATVTSPVTVKVSSANVTIADPLAGVPGAMHYHIQVDQHPFTASGNVIPDGPNDYHFWQDTIEIELEPGIHTMALIMGDNDHVRPPPIAPADFLTIQVVE